MPIRSGKFVYVRCKDDGRIVDIPIEHLEMHLKRGNWEFVEDADKFEQEMQELFLPDKSEEEQKKEEAFGCPLCEFVGKNERSLRLHKTKRHK